ncbi:glutathione synthetase-like [Microplitis mediator]|uniref:glutathione synthetase-like n=1 Tax=Microplitis mediator TaxID=375433 RepID=UPI002556EF64|nr:glutathione synthetase-like [Microplitis mediator]
MESKINKQMCLSSYIKVPLPSGELEELIEKAQDWAIMHGLAIRTNTNFSKDSMQYAPFTLLPSTFPRLEFQDACEIQTILNILIHKVAHDYEFLKETLASTICVDEFTRKLFNIYETVYNEGFNQKLSLGLFRSDFMLNSYCFDSYNLKVLDVNDSDEVKKEKSFCCWKQVEINTIASGMGWLGTVTTKFHKFVLHELGMKNLIEYLPENNAIEGLCDGMLEAWGMYNDPRAIILFVVEEFSTNICDQRGHEFEIKRRNPDVKVVRRTLKQLTSEAKLGSKKELILNDSAVVAVVYYRYGYSPEHYTEQEWKVRLLIERSLAIKSPSIQYHLAGTKKVQQALAKSGVVEKFLEDEKNVECVRKIFTGLYSLDFDEDGNRAFEMAVNNPERFVLKPQREGGGNNIYGSDIKKFLITIKNSQERNAWILMDRIYPPSQLNYAITVKDSATNNKLKELTPEAGIFGVIIGDDKNNVFVNKQVGHLFRTKKADSNEGGFIAGAAASLAGVIHAVPKYQVGNEPREMFFFREGTIVMWNTTDLECNNILEILKNYEANSYSTELVQAESEIMSYTYAEPGSRSHLKDGDIYLASEDTNLDKYTFSNAISQSVKLGIWEASLDHYIESIEFVTEDLKAGRKIKMTREQVLRKQGELFALRHHINLSSDLLDTPDFYWERDELENLYQQTCAYFDISKRTKVMNEKINHCVELVELLSSHLSDRHHVRLEWMIIILIMVEVAFELFHYLDRYYKQEEIEQLTTQPPTV